MYGAEVLTILDVRGAFNHIPLYENCRELTAFSTSKGHFHYRCVPFGIQSGPVAWNFAANIILGEFLNQSVFCYIDDILVHSKNVNEHVKLLRRIFKKLIKHNIKLKIEKCSFFKTEARYLGFKFTREGLKADDRKTFCIKNFPRPKNLKETQRFLGMCSFYRRFVPSFSLLASELYKLCKKNTQFEWTEKCNEAFEILKQKLSTPPVLAYPEMENGVFVLLVDASQIAAASVLNLRDENGDRPIEFFGRQFNETQSRYHSNELEILSLVWSLEWFRVYLYGREKFYVHTDNNAVKFLFQPNHSESRIHRWRWALQEYNFEIIHRKGKTNTVTDALSRVKLNNAFDEPSQTVFLVQTRNSSPRDDAGIPQHSDYFIEEFNNLLIETSGYDHVFYFCESMCCKMIKELQHKLKIKINFNNPQSGELHKIDNSRTAVFIKNHFITDDQINIGNKCLREIANLSIQIFKTLHLTLTSTKRKVIFNLKLSLFKFSGH